MTHANNNGCGGERWHVDLRWEEIRFGLFCAACMTKAAANGAIAVSGEIASHSPPAFRKSRIEQVGDEMVSNSALGGEKKTEQQIWWDFKRVGGWMNLPVTGMCEDRDWSLVVFPISRSSLGMKNRDTNGKPTLICFPLVSVGVL